jgi:hypothetical protein
LPARRRAGVDLVCPPLRAVVRERDDPPERELDERDDDERDFDAPPEREVDDDERDFDAPPERDLDAPPERDPDDFDELEREDDEREPDDDERDPPDRPPREDPPLLPPDDSAMTASSCPCTHEKKFRRDYFMLALETQRHARGRSRPKPRRAMIAVSPRLPRFGRSASWTATS